MKRVLIGVMGPGEGATDSDKNNAFLLGSLIAKEGWVTLTGGRNSGVMEEVNRGARSEGGLTLGILPDGDTSQSSEFVDLSIVTDMGSARNNINVLSSNVIIACGLGAGTASEIALALKAKRKVVLLGHPKESVDFFTYLEKSLIFLAHSAEEAVTISREILSRETKAS